jgi:hypothetical protein
VSPPAPFDAPEYFPPNCPRPTDGPASGIYYRLVSRVPDPPLGEFLPQAVDASGFEKKESPGSRCKKCALSVYDTEQNARGRLANRGGLHNFRHIATMDAGESKGVVRLDEGLLGLNKGHHLWWIPRGADGRSFQRFHRGCIVVG